MSARSVIARSYNTPKPRRVKRIKGTRKQLREQILGKLTCGHYELETVQCPCCMADNFAVVSNFDRDFLPVQIVLCRDCGMMYQRQRLTQGSLDEFYRLEYRELYNPGVQGNSDVYKKSLPEFQPFYKQICTMLGYSPHFVCEVGLHFGGLLNHFLRHGSRVAGTDYDESGVSFAKKELGMEDVFVGSSSELLKLDDKPDLLIYSHVIEHINDLDSEFSVMRDILKEGGYLFLAVPGATSWPLKQGNDLLHSLQLAHSHYFSLAHLTYIAARHGFRLITGDETVHALFIKTEQENLPCKKPDAYQSVYDSLRRIESAWKRAQAWRKCRQIFGLR